MFDPSLGRFILIRVKGRRRAHASTDETTTCGPVTSQRSHHVELWVWLLPSTGQILVDIDGGSLYEWTNGSLRADALHARMGQWVNQLEDAMKALAETVDELFCHPQTDFES